MSQNDYSVANADGATVRADINSALQALASQSSGASAPSTTYPFQVWVDTTNGVVKMRDSTNTTWVTLYRYGGDGPAVDINYGGYVMVTTTGAANTYAAALSPSIGTPRSGQVVRVIPHQTNTGAATFNPNSAGALPIRTVDGNALVKNEIQIGKPIELMFVSPSGSPTDDHWILLNPCDDVGTWTPTLGGSGTLGSQTYTNQTGRYVRRGRKVAFWARVTISAKDGAAAGNIIVGGLPHTAAAITSPESLNAVCAIFANASVTLDVGYTQYAGLVLANSTNILVAEMGSGVAGQGIPIANLGASSAIQATGEYYIGT
jgi:hypothetical protein